MFHIVVFSYLVKRFKKKCLQINFAFWEIYNTCLKITQIRIAFICRTSRLLYIIDIQSNQMLLFGRKEKQNK